MEPGSRDDLTVMIQRTRDGDEAARAELVGAIYDELRRQAKSLMRRERADHTLEPSALVHEALLRLLGGDAMVGINDRRHLFAAAANAMRQVLVDHARRRGARKRAGSRARVPLDEALAYFDDRGLDVVSLNEAVDRLTALHERQGLVVSFRFFLGMTAPEVAELLEVSVGTVEGDWRAARSWLRGQLGAGAG